MSSLPGRYLFFSLLLLVLGQTPAAKTIRNFTAYLTVPLQYGLAVSARNLKKPLVFVTKLAALKGENERLRTRVEDLESQSAKLKSVEQENDLLREQARIVKDLDLGGKMVLASVIGRGVEEGSSLLLDKGAAAGLKVGAPVVYKNFLVGEIVTVAPQMSKARTIFDPRFRAPATDLDAPGRAHGLVRGEYATGLLMEKILPSEKVSLGERIVSSGEGGYPANLLLGKVKEVSTGQAEVLKWARLKPLIDVNVLEKVFVVLE